MRRARRGAAAAVGMAVLLALYLVLAVQRAVAFLAAGSPLGVVLGVALLVLPVLAAVLVGRELAFGAAAARLGRRLAAEGRPAVGAGLPARASGRLSRDQASTLFTAAADEVERRPDDWRAWFDAGTAYDLCGDRRRARGAVRRAIALERVARSG